MRRHLTALAAVLAVAGGGVTSVSHASTPHRIARPGPQGIPSGAPPAAYRPEPRLPAPRGWPFGEGFPRTSGTGREARGATFWSDFLYDDHGAQGAVVRAPVATLAPPNGSYVYSGRKAANNGADIFRAAVGLTHAASYWRVDWNTLLDRHVPIAEWTFDTDNDTGTGVAAWPAGAGVRSPGIELALVVSARRARLVDAVTGRVLASLSTTVDMRARSFVVRVPRSVLPVRGTWRVRLAAGLADPAGRAFAPVSPQDGALPGQPAVYNVTFRSYLQEPPVYKPSGTRGELVGDGQARDAQYGNFWMEDHQAEALASGDVSAFAREIRWSDLAHRRTTPQPMPTGYTNRWYVTPLHLGQGVVYDKNGNEDLRPNFLGRVQPYAVYVPTSYDPTHPTPLTWILHSLDVQHNQYGALDPSQIQGECEDRQSICATTLGFGPDGWYYDEAEVDFWSVWHALAQAYTLDPNRTVISGYSMGGWASYKLGLTYPDLFAKAMPLAGPPGCGLRFAEGAGGAAGPGRCTADGDSTPMVVNARWLPYVMADGVADELVPITGVLQQVHAFDALGYRYHFELYPAEDHLVYATQDGFSTEIAQLGDPTRVINPARITYVWYPDLQEPRLGIGPTGVYWVRGLRGRDRRPGVLARIHVLSRALRDPAVTAVKSVGAHVPGDPSPALVQDQRWALGRSPRPRRALSVSADNVAALGIDMARAGLPTGTVTVTTDGRLTLRLLHLPRGTVVRVRRHVVATATRAGVAVVHLCAGRTTLSVH